MRFPNLRAFIGIKYVDFYSVIPMRRISHHIGFSSSERYHFEGTSIISFTDRRGLNYTEMGITIYEYACIRDMFFDIGFRLDFSHSLTQKPVNVTNYYIWKRMREKPSDCVSYGDSLLTKIEIETPMAFL